MEVKHHYWENIFNIIQQSYAIEKHIDFFNWLQDSVSAVLPHNILLASWGDFSHAEYKNKLSYDVTSSLGEINTQKILDSSDEIDNLMVRLHQEWVRNSRCWFVLDNLDSLNDKHQTNLTATEHALVKSILIKQQELKSMLVYGVNDIRGGNECLYVFFSKQEVLKVPDSVMGLIMPHIDNALRKIQHLSQVFPIKVKDPVKSELPANIKSIAGLSQRELEIIHWIKSGKTNQEIGLILSISPNTVKSHLKRVFQKLNATRRAQAVAMLSI